MPEMTREMWDNKDGPESACNTIRGLTRYIDSTDRRATAMVPKISDTTTCKHPGGCSRKPRVSGWCKPHYSRIARTGSPGVAAIPAPSTSAQACAESNCIAIVGRSGGYGYCTKHYQRYRKHGDTETVATGGASLPENLNPMWSGEEASYRAVHARIINRRGSASNYGCVDCGGSAAEWSYDHKDIDERRGKFGPFSTDMDHYAPRCVRCHRRFDRRHALLTGNRDHTNQEAE